MTSSPDLARNWSTFTPTALPWTPSAAAVAGADPGQSWLPALSGGAREPEESPGAIAERNAYQRGVAAGIAEERARADQRCRNALQTVAHAAAQLESIQAQFVHDRERDLHGLAVAIARQMIQRELTLDPALTAELVRRALALLPLDTVIEVRLHPDDLTVLGSTVQEFAAPGRHLQLTWVGDPLLDRGGFVLETPARVVDGRADVALRQLYERLDHD